MQRFDCPSCAAPLGEPTGAATIQCPYCSATFIVPEELRGDASEAEAEPPGVLVEDDFSDDESGWYVDDNAEGEQEYSARGYAIRLADDEWESWAFHDDAWGGDVEAEVEITKTKGPDDTWIGLLLRSGEYGSYYFTYYLDGRYLIWAYDEEEEDSYTIEEGDTAGVVNTGNATNHLRAVCHGNRLELHLNGQLALEVENGDWADGYVGLVVGRGETERGKIEVLFNRLVVSSL